jgi:glycosyltransferase involved in cell wall biosynthesis
VDRLLVFNCHEAWVHQLEGIGLELDIVVGLAGRYSAGWDERMRPVPRGSRLLTLDQAARSRGAHYAVIAHSVTDLLEARVLDAPKLVVLHTTLEGRALEEGSRVDPREMGAMLAQLLTLIGGHAVAVSALKGRSWGVVDDVVPFGVDPDAYLPATLEIASGLRISNLFTKRRRILLGELHDAAFGAVPVRLVGHNPDIAGAQAATSWDELKELLAAHRFYVHTAHPELEDGYNMATLEAMAAGLPVIGNVHPSSPVEHGVSGFLSDDPEALAGYAAELLADRERAQRMGRAAREAVSERFHVSHFRTGIRASLERARAKYPR